MEASEVATGGARSASFCEPQFACGVVALEEVDGMWVILCVLGLKVREVAAHHGDELHGVLEGVDAHKRGIVSCCDMTKGASLDGIGPYKVPPELCFRAVPPCRCEARVAARSPDGNAWDEV